MSDKNIWSSPVDRERWFGARAEHRGPGAFVSSDVFVRSAQAELTAAFSSDDRRHLAALLASGDAACVEAFLRARGPNPLFPAADRLPVPLAVAKADRTTLSAAVPADALPPILNGEVAHVLFQAGEASRFGRGPLYHVNPLELAEAWVDELSRRCSADDQELRASLADELDRIRKAAAVLPAEAKEKLLSMPLGPRQLLMLRAAVRRAIRVAVAEGFLSRPGAAVAYETALAAQKILFFVTPAGGVDAAHRLFLSRDGVARGFDRNNIVVISQETLPGLTIGADGEVAPVRTPEYRDAAGHCYALMQAVRPGSSGHGADDAFGWLLSRGARYLNVVRINDMDRHSVEIVNPQAVAYALGLSSAGYQNVIEAVGNPAGQKGGTGVTMGRADRHMLTETHENSFPAYQSAASAAMDVYLRDNAGAHPPYNAMRQIAGLEATRSALRFFGARLVFVPRRKAAGAPLYLGADMPMGDLSLLGEAYPSRLFQFVSPDGRELLIHDMKQRGDLLAALRAIRRQCEDADVIDAAVEAATGTMRPFDGPQAPARIYGAAAPELGL